MAHISLLFGVGIDQCGLLFELLIVLVQHVVQLGDYLLAALDFFHQKLQLRLNCCFQHFGYLLG